MWKIDDQTANVDAPDARQLAYWRSLGDPPRGPHPLLRTLRGPAHEPGDPRWTSCEGALPEERSAEILRVCQGSGLSLYILLVAALKAYAARATGEENIALIAPPYAAHDSGGPRHPVCISGSLASDGDMRSAILKSRRMIVGGYSHQDVSLTQVYGAQGAEDILSDTPLCALALIHAAQSTCASPFEVWFDCARSRVSWTIRFDANRFRSDLVTQFSSNFRDFLISATADYSVAIDDISLLSDFEQQRVAAFSIGPVAEIPELRLEAMVAAQARRTPGNCALVFGERQLGYADLVAHARSISANLAGMGIGPGKTVALRLATGIDAIVVQLAIMMAGASFCPIGPGEPISRLRKMLEAVGADLLLTHHDEAIGLASCRVVSPSDMPSNEAVGEHAVRSFDDPAYVIFTSGTSGTPKPVTISHHGIVNAIAWKLRAYGFSPSSRVLPLFGYEFDGFVLNVFAPLCAGATVILRDNAQLRVPVDIAHSIARQSVTHLICTPLLYEAVLSHLERAALACLDTVTLAGEAASAGLIARSRSALPHVRLTNEYGPSENAVVSTCHADLTPESVRVIGKPISNVKLLVLDRRLRPVPPGLTGEIHLGGPGLAQGHAAGATASADAFHGEGPDRLYRTGDHGRWLPDGNLEFQGRSDAYAQVHGIRVDTEEVRAAILKCGAVEQAAVLVDGPVGSEVITAFIVSSAPAPIDALASVLRHDLPAHLIPARWVQLSTLPHKSGGKLDRDALRAVAAIAVGPGKPGMAEDALTRDLAAIWSEVLGIAHIDLDESFFALGGHSLGAVRLLARIQETMGVELRLNEIYEASTIRRLREVIARQTGTTCRPQNDTAVEFQPCDGRIVLSSAQERMLVLASEHPISYNLPVLYLLRAKLDIDRLLRAMETVLERHAVLRATFHPQGDCWVAHVDEKARVEFTERPLTAGANLEAAASAAVTPFDLQTGPLIRMVLFSERSAHRMLLIDFHHIVIDEVSLATVLGELATAYAGGRLPPPVRHTYADFAAAQHREQAGERYKDDLAAAVRSLKNNEAEPLRLPFDHPETQRRSNTGSLVRRTLPEGLVCSIRELCRSAEVTEFTFFMAVFGLLLHKHTRQTNIVIGAPVSMRMGQYRDACVGLFLNTVPFRLDIRADASFLEHLGTVNIDVLEGLGRRQVEFGDLIRALGIERAYAENPLFSVLLHMVDHAVTALAFDGVQAQYRPLHSGTSKFDLTLELDLDDGTGSFTFEYPTRRFEESTIERMADHFITILTDAIRSPTRSLASLRCMGDTERDKILTWGRAHDGAQAYDEGSLASRFEHQVRQHPARIALVGAGEALTYAELNEHSNRLAHRLLKLGVLENDIVGVFCERSAKTVLAILAVQKAGAAHLPLDPYYPASRTGEMLANSGAKVLITDQLVDRLGFAGTVVHPCNDLSEFSSTDPGCYPSPESTAYVLYTSGTTGAPKGVQVAQRNIVTLVHRATHLFGLDYRDVWTLFHSVCFDVSVWEMFGALLTGARLVIVPRDLAADGPALFDFVEENRVTLLCQPPSAFYLLADTLLRAERATALRYIILGGEAIKPENFAGWRDDMPTIVNGYGITETTVYSTFHVFSRREILDRTRSIGRPVPGTCVYILDEESSLCPVGVVGELYIGGTGVGKGYLGRPDLTALRFVEDLLRPGHVLYRSGDLVRWLPDGQIEYLGRADKQLKIRGYRVEPSEVEAAMSNYSRVRESAALAAIREAGSQLIGFFTSDIQEDIRHMREYLQSHLPDYMVPSRLIQVETMPVTPNGKVDQSRLLALSAIAPTAEAVATRDEGEKNALDSLMAKTWADIIGIDAEEIGPDDSFFTLGGDSIGANLVVKLLEKQGWPIELLDIFEHPVLRDIAGLITERLARQRQDRNQVNAPYWDALGGAKTATLLPLPDRKAGTLQELSRVRVDLAPDEPASADPATSVRDMILTALCVALRMSSGDKSIRIALLSSDNQAIPAVGGAGKVGVGPAIIAVDDIHDGLGNLARVRAGIGIAEENRLDWETVLGNEALAAALADSAVVNVSNDASARDDRPACLDYLQLPPGCIAVEGSIGQGVTTIEFIAQAGANISARLRFIAEAFKLASGEIRDAVAKSAAPSLPGTVSLDVEPLSEIFFRDCTYQAVLTATRYLGGDINKLLATAVGVCRPNAQRTQGLRVAVDYVESAAFYQALAGAGISVHRSGDAESICASLMSGLTRGELGIVKLDSYHVRGHKDLYQTRHGDHTVLVCGYDRRLGVFDTVDNQPGRNILYRRTQTAFADLEAGYESYQKLFNPRGMDDSAFFVSRQGGRLAAAQAPSFAREVLLDALRRAQSSRAEETAAFHVLHDDFHSATASEASWSEHSESFMFTIGEVLLAKKLELYQLQLILANGALAQPLSELTTNLSVVLGVLSKLRHSKTYSAEKMQAMHSRLSRVCTLHLDYAKALGRLLED